MGAIEWGERRAMDPPQPPLSSTHAQLCARQAAMAGDPGTSVARQILTSLRGLPCAYGVLAGPGRPALPCDILLLIVRFVLDRSAAEAVRFRADPGPHEALRAWLGQHYFGGQPWPPPASSLHPGQRYFRVPRQTLMFCYYIRPAGPAARVRFTSPVSDELEAVVPTTLGSIMPLLPFSGLWRTSVTGCSSVDWELSLAPVEDVPYVTGLDGSAG
ncbi:MAG TPA: hypothetical protein VNI01_02300 [Elusimicrobiota bacterium]|jgi:hypothetical protein|nr:hypothetical protein [Elusimicrobiota bacterium]